MPNHWESSARPLFVKTVFVNGNRHAILSQEDPLLHSSLKKQSRPGSPLSFASSLSTSSSENQDSNSEPIKTSKRRHQLTKDISSELQSCLIKLRLASSVQKKIEEKASTERIFYDSQEEVKWNETKQNQGLKQKRKKWNHGKASKKKNYGYYYEDSMKENNRTESKNENNSCYVYNIDHNNRKKNYFLKINSKPSHFIVNCSCQEHWAETHFFCGSADLERPEKNHVVLGTTIHSLILSPEKEKQLIKNSSDYFFSFSNSNSSEIHGNNYLARSFCNSLSERVVQWLDLASKRKQKEEISESALKEVCLDTTERIFAGRTFTDEKNKTKYPDTVSNKIETKIPIKKEMEKIIQGEASDEDVESEVKVEGNVETALSVEKLEKKCKEVTEKSKSVGQSPRLRKEADKRTVEADAEQQKTEDSRNSDSIPTKINSIPLYVEDSIVNRLNSQISNLRTSGLSAREILLNSDSMKTVRDSFRSQIRKKSCREKRNSLQRQSKFQEFDELDDTDEEKDITLRTIKYPDLISARNKKNESLKKFQLYHERMTCDCDRDSEEVTKQCKSLNLALKSSEKNEKSINNQNITRSILSQNFLLPQQQQQQQNKILWSRQDAKSVWPSEKVTGKPQLHIFIPSMPSKEPSEESTSECESFLE